MFKYLNIKNDKLINKYGTIINDINYIKENTIKYNRFLLYRDMLI